MANFIKKFFSGIGAIKRKSGTYIKIHTINELLDLPNRELPNYKKVHNVDLSELDLSKYENMFSGELPNTLYVTQKEAAEHNIITDWTDKVIWPTKDNLPKGINPEKILEEAKQTPEIKKMHDIGRTGRGINIAIIDQRLNTRHPEYASNIKLYKIIPSFIKHNNIEYHGSLVSGIAVGHTTGVAPNANLYYYSAPSSEILPDGTRVRSRKYVMKALKEIIKFNQTHSDAEKIRFLSCSWGGPDDLHAQECKQLFDMCKQNGIKVIGGAYEPQKAMHFDRRYPNKTKEIGVPTDGKTTSFWQGGFKYTRQGGYSSVCPYLAGVFACACQDNQIFFTRPKWQDELTQILQDTAIESEHGGKMINPIAICERVTQIAHEMELQLAQQKRTQHE